LTDAKAKKIQLVGGRSLCHEPNTSGRWHIKRGVGNAILVKVNQIGTLSETLDAVEMRIKPATGSHVASFREKRGFDYCRSGGCNHCGQIKTGSLSRSDRLAKYNQLLRIEENLGWPRGMLAKKQRGTKSEIISESNTYLSCSI